MLIGKAKLQFRVIGCIDCGAAESPAWEDAQHCTILVDGRKHSVMVKRCVICAAKRGSAWAQAIVNRTPGNAIRPSGSDLDTDDGPVPPIDARPTCGDSDYWTKERRAVA